MFNLIKQQDSLSVRKKLSQQIYEVDKTCLTLLRKSN